MYLEKLELQGFKSFAHKTTMEFPAAARGANPGIAAIVGPNGSGKSNTADAVRWVLGEQSLKLLRGKRAEDVIFSGSASLARLGFAEVALYLNNEDKKTDIEYEKIAIKRRVYRDGSSEYRINGRRVRLSDIQLLLAQANFGGRSYSVIGQGATDAILSASPFERKNFFDEATGVKQFQIKRDAAKAKLKTTEENIGQIKSLIREISPRLKMLEQQIEKREKRSILTKELQKLQLEHFGSLWHGITEKLQTLLDKRKRVGKSHLSLTKKLSELQNALAKQELEQKAAQIGGYDRIQSGYHQSLAKKNELGGLLAGVTRELAVLEEVEKTHPTALDAEKLAAVVRSQIDLLVDMEKAETLDAFRSLKPKAKKLHADLLAILNEKQPPARRTGGKIAELGKIIASLKQELERAEKDVQEKQNLVDKLRHAESKATTNVFETQRKYQELQREMNQMITEKNQLDVEIAKVETRKQDVGEELNREAAGALHAAIKNYHPGGRAPTGASWEKIAGIKQELEMIGGMDEHAESEYEEAKQRHDFLSSQLLDLESALEKTKRALVELDATIASQFNRAFQQIEKGFGEYFKILFSGGNASLVLYRQSELETLNEDVVAGLTKKEQESLARNIKTGIEIKASPPGKKVASISMLSGGERALTSIALICAIIRANPAPFVVLDEVDAALDEANSERFAQILAKLAHNTQCIAITHNRATMEQSNILYGVTMGENGVSKLLSVDLEKAVAGIA
ncbi:MAG: chromosome segregation protein SMC [Parcubacteria group bacterium]|nr:chromosome segregation protein SMC [Parcubacteria group bacterium]